MIAVRSRPHRELRVVQGFQQLRVRRAVHVEVRADTEHDPAPAVVLGHGGQQGVEKPAAFVLVPAEREELLELVDHHDQFGPGLTGEPMQGTTIGHQVRVQLPRRRTDHPGKADRALLQRMRPRREHHGGGQVRQQPGSEQ